MKTDTPRTDEIAHMGLDADTYIGRMTYLCRELEREVASLKKDRDFLSDTIDQYKRGAKGACYACEPVGEYNQKLEKEIELLTTRVSRAVNELTNNNLNAK